MQTAQANSVSVIGNPNCGKTTLFNLLTGSKQKVGNWAGVTVEKKTGITELNNNQSVEVTDLPGTYSLDNDDHELSLDEKIARDYLENNQGDLVLNIVDATRLERSLYLTTQLVEMGANVIVVLNMQDVAIKQGIHIDSQLLSKLLGLPVVTISATKRQGIDELKGQISKSLSNKQSLVVAPSELSHPPTIKTLCDSAPALKQFTAEQLTQLVNANSQQRLDVLNQWVSDQTDAQALLNQFDDAYQTIKANQRYQVIQSWVEQVCQQQQNGQRTLTDYIDDVVLNRWLGIPIFLLVMYCMFIFAINIGGAFIDFFDISFAAVFVEGAALFYQSLGLPAWLVTLLSDGIGGGVQLVATFIPVIAGLYFFLSFIEDSGYMARAAFVMDRFMRAVGLPGKSFVPLIVGFGCNVPSVMASRTLDTHKDRLLTIAMSPFMSCGARLSVYALFAAAFFANSGHNIVFLLYLLGIVMAILTGMLLKRTLFKPTLTPFIMELPAYHMPSMKNVLIKTWDKLHGFITRAGKTIVVVVTLLSFLNSWGTDGTFGNQDSEKSVLSQISRTITPVFEPIGVQQQNWPATVGIFTGIFAKEAVVGTLDALYGQIDISTNASVAASDEADNKFSLSARFIEAWQTIPANLVDMYNNIFDPLGLGVVTEQDLTSAADAQGVQISTFQAMALLFGSTAAAFSYLVFVLLYTPCVAVMGAMYREAGLKWMSFIALWSTGLAYITASTIYQVATFAHHPYFSTMWLVGCALFVSVVIFLMKQHGKKIAKKEALLIPVVNIH
ncbi:ferrous iron transport protein B [Catenovulum agarivorans DS-2]|uniref:Ferrous iron transport protein B n=1 Tax=Catenovulum agarivorans DS-2 TaxID=1328313 RepID=W7R3B6_9ALTE|nr:Fe(2+) transporter permease subunit FeoB [Catenovulum agarivorans]EWH12125.1 ferrous iron transport protein B [Catenovulum agarivorans DS-2]